MRGRVYDPRLRRFASPDPLSEVPVRMPLGCLLEPCDEAEETGPVEGSYGVSLTRFGGDESRYQAESSTGRGSGASSFGRGARDSDGNELGLAELDLLTQRAGVEPASSQRFVPVTHLDSLNRYAYAYNSPVQYRDPSGYAVETIWDLANIAMGVASAGKNLATGNYAGAAVDVAGVVVDTVAAVVPGPPGGAGTAIRVKRAADAAEAAADAARQAQRAKTTVKATDKAAEAGDAAKKTEGAIKKEARGDAADKADAPTSGETAATARGRDVHKNWQPPPGFQKEFRLPSGRKADAVNLKTRQVIELKPNNKRAIREGAKQVQEYVKELEKMTGQPWTGWVQTY